MYSTRCRLQGEMIQKISEIFTGVSPRRFMKISPRKWFLWENTIVTCRECLKFSSRYHEETALFKEKSCAVHLFIINIIKEQFVAVSDSNK